MSKTIFMVTNIVEAIQQKLGYPSLKKVDPNTQEIKDARKMSAQEKLPQAAIPAVLAAAIKYSDSKDGINLLTGDDNRNWLTTIYCGKENDAIQKVADYSGATPDEARKQMENISNETVTILKNVVKSPDAEKLRSFMNSQRHNILSHLPGSMKMGEVLNEETFDDRTNKMEGPVSGFLHRIEDII